MYYNSKNENDNELKIGTFPHLNHSIDGVANFLVSTVEQIDLGDGMHITIMMNGHTWVKIKNRIYIIQKGFTKSNNFQFEPLTR